MKKKKLKKKKAIVGENRDGAKSCESTYNKKLE
jgi:hypothetical protein